MTIAGDLINFESGRSTFKGNVEAKQFLAGSRNGLNITVEGYNDDESLPSPADSKISFNVGSYDENGMWHNDSRAYFTMEGNGMMLCMKNSDGNWYHVDFTKWQQGGSVSSIGLDLYSKNSTTNRFEKAKTVYYTGTLNNNTVFYNNPGCTDKFTSSYEYCTFETRPGVVVRHDYGPEGYRNELWDSSVYRQVSFGSDGKMTKSNNKYIVIISGSYYTYLTYASATNTEKINITDIYMANSSNRLSDVASSNTPTSFNVIPMSYVQQGPFPGVYAGPVF